MRFVALAVATSGGIGYIPFAPGTIGSLAGLFLWWLFPGTVPVHLTLIIGLFAIGSWSGSVAERHFASTDPGPVVIDEVLGMLVTLFLNPVGWVGALLGFVLFRASDIIKPYPANKLEQLHGGIGVMADDLMAAVYANLALRAILAATHWVIG
jgi:phosphatidylglycerophosphatase A